MLQVNVKLGSVKVGSVFPYQLRFLYSYLFHYCSILYFLIYFFTIINVIIEQPRWK